jgi:hypothetical protein
MFDLIKNQWIGLVALALVAVLVLPTALTDKTVAVDTEEYGASELTTISNPHLFTASTTFSGTELHQGAVTFSGTLGMSGAVTMSSTLNNYEKVTTLTGSTTLTNAQTNTTFMLTTSGGTTTLPAVGTATGTVFRFVVATALTGTYNADILSAEGDNMEGSLIVAGAVVDCDATDRVAFITDGENLGDFLEIRSNGQKWFVTSSNALTSAKLLCDG